LVILLITSGYFSYKAVFKGNQTSLNYVATPAEKGSLIISVSGSGQVSSANQVDIKAKTSGEIIAVLATLGKEVKAGDLLLQVDTSDAQTNLETAKLELDELMAPVDELSLFQAQNALDNAQSSLSKAQSDLVKSYEDGFNKAADCFLELPAVMSGLEALLHGYDLSTTQANINYYGNVAGIYDNKALEYRDIAENDYQKARQTYDANFDDYKTASIFSSTNVIEVLLDQTYQTTKNISQAVKSSINLIQFYQDKLIERGLKASSLSTTHISSLSDYLGTVNSQVSGLLSISRSIDDYKDAITTAERSIQEKSLSLAKIEKGPDELDIRAKKIVIQQKQDSLLTAEQALSDCYIKAPFSGVIVKTDIKKGAEVSTGAILAAIAAKQKIAAISLNEVDIAQVKTGQKAILTLDAVSDLGITGEVVEVDGLGTVSQGVVNYTVKIAFDTQDERVKSGMSITANIITNIKQDVILVPNSAVKSSNGEFVLILDNNVPRNQTVEIGLSNDTMTEIISGVNEGDEVVTQTITAGGSQKSSAQQNTGIRIPGVSGGFR